MAAIDVGGHCDAGLSSGLSSTVATAENPANLTGTIDYVCIDWNVEPDGNGGVASYSADGNDLTTTDWETLPDRGAGVQEYNAPGDFSAFNINSGDYIGAYGGGAGKVAYQWGSGASGFWYLSGNNLNVVDETFTFLATHWASVSATGTEAGAAAAPTGALDGCLVGPFAGPIGGL